MRTIRPICRVRVAGQFIAPSRRHHSIRCAQLLRDHRGDAKPLENKEISVQGLISSVRSMKSYSFAALTDGSTINPVQVVLTSDLAQKLTKGASVEISGTWSACPPGKQQTHELIAKEVKLIGETDAETYPLQKKYTKPDTLRQIPHLRVRTPFNSLLSRFRSSAIFHFTDYFNTHCTPHSTEPFVQVHPPLVTSSDCEGAGEVFTVSSNAASTTTSKDEPFFGSPRYLTVSSQLHLEAYAAELGNVWTLSPTFRAEKSDTPRHLAEFYMLEAEMQYVDDIEPLMSLIEDSIRYVTTALQESEVGQEMQNAERDGKPGTNPSSEANQTVQARWKALLEPSKWQRMSYFDALLHLDKAAASNKKLFKVKPTWKTGLNLEHEKWLVENIAQNRPIFITHYPQSVKPFYMAPSPPSYTSTLETTIASTAIHLNIKPEETTTVQNFDLLFPSVAEVAGGSLREHNLPELITAMRSHGMLSSTSEPSESPYPHLSPSESLRNLQWYADLRRFGSAPHGGFGIGFDRLLAYLAGVDNLRDVVAFPRYVGRGEC